MSDSLKNLTRLNPPRLLEEDSEEVEVRGFVEIGNQRLQDAKNTDLSLNSRFVLAYDANFSFAYGALRKSGYRANKNAQGHRTTVIQTLEHTLNIESSQWKVVSSAHTKRNGMEYEGYVEVGEQLVNELIEIAELIQSKLIS